MKSNFANFSDRIFLYLSVWLLVVFILGYFMSDIFLKLIVSTSITLLFLRLIKNKKQVEDYSILKEFSFLSLGQQLDFIHEKLCSRYPAVINENLIIINKTGLFFKLSDEKVSLSEVVEQIQNAKNLDLQKLIFLSSKGYTIGAVEGKTRSDFNVVFWDEKQTYDFLKTFNALLSKPEKSLNKKGINTFLRTALDKSRTKSYCLTALLMLISAYFTSFSAFYLIISAVCITLALASATNLYNLITKQKDKT